MANYPVSITLTNPSTLIMELTDVVINVGSSNDFGGAYVRQIGSLVENCKVDDFVQYKLSAQTTFQQAGVTFAYIDSRYVLFIQAALS